jgi:uncharacterized protein
MDLTDAELEELDQLLADTPKPLSPLDVVLLDGYLCAVLVQPRLVPVAEWLPPIFDTDGRAWSVLDDPAAQERTRRIENLAQRRLAAINELLAEEAWFDPVIPSSDEPRDGLPNDGAGTGEPQPPATDLTADQIRSALAPWASGFEYGLAVIPDLADHLEALEHNGPASAGSAGAVADPQAASLALARVLRSLPPVNDEQAAVIAELDQAQPLTTLDNAIDDLVGGVADLWDLTREARYRVAPRRLDTPKVGRNDPCPCGSGRKYKRCHGA